MNTIGNYPIQVPYLEDGMRLATLLEWHVEDGATVQKGQVICELESGGKVTSLGSWDTGIIVILAEKGKQCAVRELVAYVKAEEKVVVWNEPMNIQLTFEKQEKIDLQRGEERRSKFLRRIVQEFIDQEFGPGEQAVPPKSDRAGG